MVATILCIRCMRAIDAASGEQKSGASPLRFLRAKSSGGFDVFLCAGFFGVEVGGGNHHCLVECLDAERQSGGGVAEAEHGWQSGSSKRLHDVGLTVVAEAYLLQATGIIGEHGKSEHHASVDESSGGCTVIASPMHAGEQHEI